MPGTGTTWLRSETHTHNTFYNICFPTISTGWVVGENGSILKTTEGTTRVTPPANKTALSPSGYRLDQNYPNPFNPETAIRFSIPQKDHVTLKIFDLLGREVATLVNGPREAGTFQILYHAGNLPSGIYFYRLEATEFVQTRKFIIQK